MNKGESEKAKGSYLNKAADIFLAGFAALALAGGGWCYYGCKKLIERGPLFDG